MNKKFKIGILATCFSLVILAITSFKMLEGNDPMVDQYGQKLIDAIRLNNSDQFYKLMINVSDYTDIVMATDMSDDEKIEEIERFKERYKDYNNDAFILMIKKISDSGMDVLKLKLDRVTTDYTEEHDMRPFNITVYFSDGTRSGELRSWQCYKTRNGIKLTSCPYFKKGSILDPTCDAFAKEIFDMLKKENKEEYRKYVITNNAFIALVRSSTFESREQEKIIEEINKKSPEKNVGYHFHSLMADLYKKNIDLTKAQNLTWEYKRETEKGVDLVNITLYFEYDAKKYEIRTREIFKTPAGWKLSREFDFSRSSAYDDYEDEVEAIDEVYEAPEAYSTDSVAMDPDLERQMEELNREIQRLVDSINHQHEADSIKAVELERGNKKKKKK